MNDALTAFMAVDGPSETRQTILLILALGAFVFGLLMIGGAIGSGNRRVEEFGMLLVGVAVGTVIARAVLGV